MIPARGPLFWIAIGVMLVCGILWATPHTHNGNGECLVCQYSDLVGLEVGAASGPTGLVDSEKVASATVRVPVTAELAPLSSRGPPA
jgi:hypothetical protein